MNALLSEIARLYATNPQASLQKEDPAPPLTDAAGLVRCAVLELARPADWKTLGAVWQGVQTDLALPAPAIAINGSDGYQLWFSWQQPLRAEEAARFMQLLCQRYLPTVASQRLRCFPGTGALASAALPALQVHDEQWSAFIAPDLAAVFAEEPWLDRDPGQDAQAQLLGRLQSIRPQVHAKALQHLQPAASPDAEPSAEPGATASIPAHYPTQTPAAFLQAVMQDSTAPLALRIQAATALLGDTTDLRRG